ncbi:hypothetical protein Tco_0111427 [Tanacetum coccineum]
MDYWGILSPCPRTQGHKILLVSRDWAHSSARYEIAFLHGPGFIPSGALLVCFCIKSKVAEEILDSEHTLQTRLLPCAFSVLTFNHALPDISPMSWQQHIYFYVSLNSFITDADWGGCLFYLRSFPLRVAEAEVSQCLLYVVAETAVDTNFGCIRDVHALLQLSYSCYTVIIHLREADPSSVEGKSWRTVISFLATVSLGVMTMWYDNHAEGSQKRDGYHDDEEEGQDHVEYIAAVPPGCLIQSFVSRIVKMNDTSGWTARVDGRHVWMDDTPRWTTRLDGQPRMDDTYGWAALDGRHVKMEGTLH